MFLSLTGITLSAPPAQANDYYSSITEASAANVDWMSRVPDGTSLSWLSVPGTHDSLALCGERDPKTGKCGGVATSIAQTQENHGFSAKTLTTQYRAGIRALDIRVRLDKGDEGLKFTVHHGSAHQYANFTDVLNVTRDFLRAEPGETVLLHLKAECDGGTFGCEDADGYRTDAWRTSGAYAKDAAAFDSDHFAVWGRQVAQDKSLIREQVARYRPDLLLVGLGFNDMGWFVSDAPGTLAGMKTFVDEARAAKPDVEFALANVPQRERIGGRDDLITKTDTYNRLLADAVPDWDTAASPVKLVDWRGAYDCAPASCPAAYDGLHPNARGEFQIAGAFADTLHEEFGLGTSALTVPAGVPARPGGTPAGVKAASADTGIVVTWDPVFGAFGYEVRSRPAGTTAWSTTRVTANRSDSTWVVDGQRMEYQVRADTGGSGGTWSGTVSATARPKTAAGPVGIVTRPTATGVDLAWGTPTGPYTDTIDRYGVIAYDRDTPGAFIETVGTRGKSLRFDGLKPGHRYTLAVQTWNGAGGGMPALGRPVVVCAGTPSAPTGLKVTSTDATTVRLDWTGSAAAAGYRVWVRNVTGGGPSTADEHVVEETSHGIAFLFPGVWNFEFCVTAVNGALESGKSSCVVAPRPAGS
ncbi:phosphatidylinositol-specific phospholipase C domain-containing protein [Streptomyces sp. NPDC090056]|uniref:phosphatidylinositol-specific phospholipase C domain-containing protein n=1 Tax=Streptomyces sp. NPDC090056 TaxID=3365934 RepID=UPI003829C733